MKTVFYLTQEGVTELQAEQKVLLKKRVETAEAIRTAREMGDLSENAEYQSARQEQEKNDTRLDEIEHILSNVEIIKADGKSNSVRLGSTVELKSAAGKVVSFQVVGTIEADPAVQKISDESPIGKALLGKKQGDSVEIKTPIETITYEVIKIS